MSWKSKAHQCRHAIVVPLSCCVTMSSSSLSSHCCGGEGGGGGEGSEGASLPDEDEGPGEGVSSRPRCVTVSLLPLADIVDGPVTVTIFVVVGHARVYCCH